MYIYSIGTFKSPAGFIKRIMYRTLGWVIYTEKLPNDHII